MGMLVTMGKSPSTGPQLTGKKVELDLTPKGQKPGGDAKKAHGTNCSKIWSLSSLF